MDELIKSLKKVLNYVHDDEREHYNESNTKEKKNHIYLHIQNSYKLVEKLEKGELVEKNNSQG